MSSEWREYSLLDIYDVTNGLNKGRKEFGFGYPFLTFKEVFYNYFVPEELTSLANTNTKERHKCSVRTGDVFITRTSETFDELGMSCVATKDYPDASFNGFCKRLRPNGSVEIDARYSAFFFNSPGFRQQVLSLANMSTRASLNNDMLKSLTVKLPPLDVQQGIAKVLADLHDKIQLNHHLNQTLEEIAQAIFKSWFVDFEPVKAKIAALDAGGSEEDALLAAMQVITGDAQECANAKEGSAPGAATGGKLARLQAEQPEQYAELRATAELFPSAMQHSELGEIPEGWSVAPISDFGKVVCGKTPSKQKPEFYGSDIPFIKIPDMHGNMFATKTGDHLSSKGAASQSKKAISKGSICVSCIATVGQVVIATEESHTNQQINSIVPLEEYYTPYLYFRMGSLYKDLHDLASGGSATLNLNTGSFSRIQILMPSEELLDSYGKYSSVLLGGILNNVKEAQTLGTLRDNLLPKLLFRCALSIRS